METTGVTAGGSSNPPDLSHLRPVYLALLVAGGHVGLPILVSIFIFSKSIRRPLTVINFCISWIIYSVSYCLPYGVHYEGGHAPFKLCLAQAAMVHGAPPMAVVAGLGVVLQVWSTLRYPWQPAERIPPWLRRVGILLPPYLVFASYLIAVLILGIKYPDSIVAPNGLYCTIHLGNFQRYAVPVFCASLLVLIISLEVYMFIRYWRARCLRQELAPLSTWRPSLSPWFRISIFSLYCVISLGTCISYLTQYAGALPYMTQATMPLVATLIFSSQTDIFQLCCFWRKKQTFHSKGVVDRSSGGWSISNDRLSLHSVEDLA